jgi:hypothetical protein
MSVLHFLIPRWHTIFCMTNFVEFQCSDLIRHLSRRPQPNWIIKARSLQYLNLTWNTSEFQNDGCRNECSNDTNLLKISRNPIGASINLTERGKSNTRLIGGTSSHSLKSLSSVPYNQPPISDLRQNWGYLVSDQDDELIPG